MKKILCIFIALTVILSLAMTREIKKTANTNISTSKNSTAPSNVKANPTAQKRSTPKANKATHRQTKEINQALATLDKHSEK